MISDPSINLANYRFTKALEHLDSARTLLETKHFRDSISRSYYAILTATRALLALLQVDSKSHKGVITLFNQHYIKTEILPKKCGEIFGQVQSARLESDYGDFDIISKEEALENYRNAEFFLSTVKKHVPSLDL